MYETIGPTLDQIFDVIPAALLIIDGSGTILHANQEAGIVFGATASELAGLPAAAVIGPAADQRWSGVAEARTGRRLDGQEFRAECRGTTIEDEHARVEIVCVRPLGPSTGNVDHWLLNELGVVSTYAWLLRQRIVTAASGGDSSWEQAVGDADQLELALSRLTEFLRVQENREGEEPQVD